ncbi:hypothetical protein FOPG_10295 [Fusarium oxysporum f. sp. conglutinans race 2 54008]|uniref:Uncharacterized protein n=1 Tax=Fusarium oxysporum f. sp. conglutinans race 2 54008 TaxID=1089457 RepID=X0HEZ1_FUSOX|nr:hypothetical protein FOPG_10295 [Fusarium oxysporum f. sp. conglutinans race 2 54008]
MPSISPVLACQAINQPSDPHFSQAWHLDSISFLCPCFSKSATNFNSRARAAESVTVTLSSEGGIRCWFWLFFGFCFFVTWRGVKRPCSGPRRLTISINQCVSMECYPLSLPPQIDFHCKIHDIVTAKALFSFYGSCFTSADISSQPVPFIYVVFGLCRLTGAI